MSLLVGSIPGSQGRLSGGLAAAGPTRIPDGTAPPIAAPRRSSIVADLTTLNLAVAFSGSTTVVTDVSNQQALAAAIAGSTTLTANVSGTEALAVAISGSTQVAPAISSKQSLVVAIAGSTALTANVSGTVALAAVISGSTQVSPTTSTKQSVVVIIAGSTTVTENVSESDALNVTINGSTSVTATASGRQDLVSAITGNTGVAFGSSQVDPPSVDSAFSRFNSGGSRVSVSQKIPRRRKPTIKVVDLSMSVDGQSTVQLVPRLNAVMATYITGTTGIAMEGQFAVTLSTGVVGQSVMQPMMTTLRQIITKMPGVIPEPSLPIEVLMLL